MRLFCESGATLSPCRTYRYDLWRIWGDGPVGCWIMLNPSTADAETNDPTVERCQRRARDWGWGGMHVVNLFALRSTDPAALRQHPNPIGPENDAYILSAARAADRWRPGSVICGWGAHGRLLRRGSGVASALRFRGIALRCLRVTSRGEPAHPLYLPYTLQPRPYCVEAAS